MGEGQETTTTEEGAFTDTKKAVEQASLLIVQAIATIERLCQLADQLARLVAALEEREFDKKGSQEE